MIAFFANLFGYVLNFLYEVCNNYGVAIILFSIIVKFLMLPLAVKQHKTVKKTNKLQNEMKQIQFKYRNNHSCTTTTSTIYIKYISKETIHIIYSFL